MNNRYRSYYYIALVLGIVFHASVLFFTFEKTYDAFVHIFFADHYADNWFESWSQKWYTGFTITSYPPLVHQIIALLSKLVGLKMAYYLSSIGAVFLLIRGVYKFALLWVDEHASGIAAIATVFTSSIVEALHLFGQLPSLMGIALLLNACPEVYKWFRFHKYRALFLSLALLTVTTTAHHVSTIFGMVFFVLPVIGLAVMDKTLSESKQQDRGLMRTFVKNAISTIPRAVFFGASVIALTIFVIFPYWYWSQTDPISQVPIPHGSRENFILNSDLGLIFFLIPWGMMLFFLPFLFKHVFSRRNIFLGLSISLALALGTGGTTPLPKLILGETAFEILTLDRFTFWATMLSLPFWGLFLKELIFGSYKNFLVERFGKTVHLIFINFFLLGILLSNVLIVNLSNFRAFQPDKIDIKPIQNFLGSDQHEKWRYITLGFGDQMAWLSANTDALTVDGNYHSARRLPEFTTRAVERLENAKYQKMEGIGALQDILSNPNKFHLKFVFSNDKFYDPLLYFYGWDFVQRLENNIALWEHPDVNPLPSILPDKTIPSIQRFLWGVVPISVFLLTLFLYVYTKLTNPKDRDKKLPNEDNLFRSSDVSWSILSIWIIALTCITISITLYNYYKNQKQGSIENTVLNYFDAIDFKRFDEVYEYYDPENKPIKEQYKLERSLEDGIISSFAKLDAIDISLLERRDSIAKVSVNAFWITALDKYETTHMIDLVKRDSRWYIKYKEYEKTISSEQFFSLPSLSFKKQGRRRSIAGKTDQEDILDRPEIRVNQCNLVEKDSSYFLVGELQNIDAKPAKVFLNAVLFDSLGNNIHHSNSKDCLVHDLLPKESTSFRIDLDISCDTAECLKSNFTLVIYVSSSVIDKDLFKYYGIDNIQTNYNYNRIEYDCFNYGVYETNIPQIITSYYDRNDKIFWVDRKYLAVGIRPQKSKRTYSIIRDKHFSRFIEELNLKILINGQPNENTAIEFSASDGILSDKIKIENDVKMKIQLEGFVYDLNN